jgi:hypothetical protein
MGMVAPNFREFCVHKLVSLFPAAESWQLCSTPGCRFENQFKTTVTPMLNHSPRMSELLDSVLTVTTFTIGYPFLLNETSIEFGGVWQDCTDISRVSFYSHKDNILRGLFKISINNLRISIMLREWSKVKQVTHCHTFTNNVACHYHVR